MSPQAQLSHAKTCSRGHFLSSPYLNAVPRTPRAFWISFFALEHGLGMHQGDWWQYDALLPRQVDGRMKVIIWWQRLSEFIVVEITFWTRPEGGTSRVEQTAKFHSFEWLVIVTWGRGSYLGLRHLQISDRHPQLATAPNDEAPKWDSYRYMFNVI